MKKIGVRFNFWWVYFFNMALTLCLLILKQKGCIEISFFLALLPVTLFTLGLAIVMVIFAKGILEERENGKS